MSRSPPKRERVERERSRSPRYSRSPKSKISPPPKSRKRSVTPEERSPVKVGSSPKRTKLAAEQDKSDYSESPRARNRSPASPERDSPASARYESPSEANGAANGHSGSPSPLDDRSPIKEEEENTLSPGGSLSP